MARLALIPPLVLCLAAAGCEQPRKASLDAPATTQAPPPLEGVANAYEEAGKTHLAETPPGEYPGLHNVYRLSEYIVSGSEPHGEEAFATVADMGVKTLLSVDGKVPDRELAAKYGMRYVHVPIHYSGISEDELVRIVKTFRELDGPFYIHCFHGRHRGPAAAAVGRLVVDGASRGQALAEMRQWCGTSDKYEGLYRTVATMEIPSAGKTYGYEWDFPAAHPLGDFRQAMIDIARHWDNVKLLGARGWEPDPDHPDLDPLNESEKLADLFARGAHTDTVRDAQEDFRAWMEACVAESARLRDSLRQLRTGEEAGATATRAFRVLNQSCNDCHGSYRNG